MSAANEFVRTPTPAVQRPSARACCHILTRTQAADAAARAVVACMQHAWRHFCRRQLHQSPVAFQNAFGSSWQRSQTQQLDERLRYLCNVPTQDRCGGRNCENAACRQLSARTNRYVGLHVAAIRGAVAVRVTCVLFSHSVCLRAAAARGRSRHRVSITRRLRWCVDAVRARVHGGRAAGSEQWILLVHSFTHARVRGGHVIVGSNATAAATAGRGAAVDGVVRIAVWLRRHWPL